MLKKSRNNQNSCFFRPELVDINLAEIKMNIVLNTWANRVKTRDAKLQGLINGSQLHKYMNAKESSFRYI